MAPLAMVLYLAEAETAVTRMARANGFFQQISFIDDRNFVVDSPASLQQACTSWRQWCQRLGLKENHHKMKVLCKSLDLVQQIRDSGFEHHCIVDNLRVLGVDFGSNEVPSIVKREEVAQTIWRRLALLPVSMAQKRSLFRSRAVPLLTWGWWLVSPQIGFCKTWMGNMKTAVCNLNNLASNELWHILEGHWTDSMFISGQEAVKSYFRAEKFWHDQGFVFGNCKWATRVAEFLHDFGFQKLDNGLWRLHTITFDFRCDDAIFKATLNHFAHSLREAFRHQQMLGFVASSRRDAREIVTDFVYDPKVLTAASKLYKQANSHQRAVMLGAALSPAAYDKIADREVSTRCILCGQCRTPDWRHVAWDCMHFHGTRPPEPHCSLQKRLDWPSMGRYDLMTLKHLAAVRRVCLEQVGFRR
jgi:hypothetical protein